MVSLTIEIPLWHPLCLLITDIADPNRDHHSFRHNYAETTKATLKPPSESVSQTARGYLMATLYSTLTLVVQTHTNDKLQPRQGPVHKRYCMQMSYQMAYGGERYRQSEKVWGP